MIASRFWSVIVKQVVRHRTRTLLTIGGVAIAMFLFVTVQTLQHGVNDATQLNAADQTLIVYRENRFCPAASRLPEFYGDRIAKMPGVAEVIPMKIVVTNCAASLDVVTFRGIAESNVPTMSKKWTMVSGSVAEWMRRGDAAIVGERLAQRRGLRIGQSFAAAGVNVTVAGIFRSDGLQDPEVAYVHLPFLQQTADKDLGIVTQFNVIVQDPALLDQVAKAIDAEFHPESEPTQTRPERAFIAQAGSDVVDIVRFTGILGWGCLAAVLALVANAIILAAQDRIKEHAVLQTLGFRSGLIARLILTEGMLIAVLGGVLGAMASLALLHYGNFSLYNEGLSISIAARPAMVGQGLMISALIGVLAGLVPAAQAARREITQCFRAV